MRRPTVLHVVEHWARPSERFVVDTVRSTTATRAVVAAQHRIASSPAGEWDGPVVDLSRCLDAVEPDPSLTPLAPRRIDQVWAPLPVHAAMAAVAVVGHADLLYAHFALSAHRTWRVARRLSRPFGVAAHGWDLLVAARRDDAIAEAVRAADLVVVPSEFLAGHARALGVDDDVLRVVPSGVDLSRFRWRERQVTGVPPLVTFAGRFVDKKGVLDAARALAAVAADRPLRARFVGHGPLDDDLRRLLRELRLDAEVVDGRDPDAVPRALADTDIVMTASRTADDGDAETLGMINLEAQACGAPVVTTRHGGVPEAVSAAAARLVDERGDIAGGLAAALRDLLDDGARWPQMSRAAREHVAARFELGARTADLEELWQALAHGRRGRDLPCVATPAAAPLRASVILVTHNRRRLVDLTLDALARQTHPADEVVVVDNGSDDGTAQLLAARVRQQSPNGLRVLTREANLPVADGRNQAVAASTGDVVVFTDDDCRPRETWIEALLAGLRDGVGLVQGRTTADPDQPLVPLSRTQWTPAEFGLYETCNVAYRRSALDASGPVAPEGPFDVRFAEIVAETLGRRWERFPFGEDTELGWRVKRSGVRSRFAVHAVVDHEIWPPDPALLVRRAALTAAFPVLVRRVPELRQTFLWRGYVLGPHRARLWLAVAGVATSVVRRDARPLLAAVPYADDLLGLRTWGRPGGRRARLAAAPTLLRRDLVETAALIRGSWRARTLVV